MRLLQLFVLIGQAGKLCSAYSVCETVYSLKKTCSTNYGTILDSYTDVGSILRCAVRCTAEMNCQSVIFDSARKLCVTNTGTLSDVTTGCDNLLVYMERTHTQGWHITGANKEPYVCSTTVQPGDSTTVPPEEQAGTMGPGEACSSKSDCKTTNIECLYGFCTCNLGHKLNSALDSCVPECTSFVNTFQTHPGYIVEEAETKEDSTMSFANCINLCLSKEACSIAYYKASDNNCRLYSMTALGSARYKNTGNGNDEKVYQRNCATP